jgi:hypothetical protein
LFHAAVSSAGTCRLYLDFKHQGLVRTAEFTVTSTGLAAASPTDDSSNAHTDH